MTEKTKPDQDIPTRALAYWLNLLLSRNRHTKGAAVDQMFLGPNIFVVTFSRPVVIEGQASDIDKTADIIDLIKSYQAGGE